MTAAARASSDGTWEGQGQELTLCSFLSLCFCGLERFREIAFHSNYQFIPLPVCGRGDCFSSASWQKPEFWTLYSALLFATCVSV